MVCGSGGEIKNLDQDQIGDYQINNPAFCAGRFSSLVFQAVLFGGIKKGLTTKLNSTKTPTATNPTTGNKVKVDPIPEEGATSTKKPGVKDKPIIDPDCIASATTNDNLLYAFLFGIKVEAGCVGLKHTNSTARAEAAKYDFTETKQFPNNLNSHGELVFKYKNNYLSPDNTVHNFNYAWKVFDKNGNRIGTGVFENGELVIKKY